MFGNNYDNLPPGCTVRDIDRQCEDDDDRPDVGMDPDLWDDRDIVAADEAVLGPALAVARQLMGLPPLKA